MAWIRRVLGAIGKNVAVIISLSSMMVAVMSLYFTINAQKADLEYKEIAIQPRPGLTPLFENLSLTLQNLGLGPAIVKQVDFEQDGKCFTSYGKSTGEWSELYQGFLKKAAAELFSASLPPMPWIKAGKKAYDFEVDSLQVDDTVRSNEDRFVFRLEAGTLKEFQQLDSTVQTVAKDKFGKMAYKFPLIVTFCSATERTCMSVGEAKSCEYLHVKGK